MPYGRGIMALVSLSVALAACDSDDTAGPGRKAPTDEPLRVIEASGDLATSGEAALGATTDDVSDGGADDLVITDDFLYGEPQPE